METKSDIANVPQQPILVPLAFDQRLKADKEWGLSEGSLFLEGKGIVHETLRRICKRLDELGIPYAVVGGMALFEHGFERFTKDVDLLVTRDSLRRLHEQLEGLGYVAPFALSKNLRDVQTGVRIEFLVTGQYPGDGSPKPVAFPDPDNVSVVLRGMRVVNLKTLVELKLASGMTTDRVKDLGDVQELIKELEISREFASELDPYVRDKFLELWRGAHRSSRRFVRIEQKGAITAQQLSEMQAAGVVVQELDGQAIHLLTTDSELARKYEMHEESEFRPPND